MTLYCTVYCLFGWDSKRVIPLPLSGTIANCKNTRPSSMDDYTQLDRVIKLFTGPNSDQLHERHCSSIERLCEGASGFAIADLPKAEQILELTFGLLASGFQGFLEPACKLLRYTWASCCFSIIEPGW